MKRSRPFSHSFVSSLAKRLHFFIPSLARKATSLKKAIAFAITFFLAYPTGFDAPLALPANSRRTEKKDERIGGREFPPLCFRAKRGGLGSRFPDRRGRESDLPAGRRLLPPIRRPSRKRLACEFASKLDLLPRLARLGGRFGSG